MPDNVENLASEVAALDLTLHIYGYIRGVDISKVSSAQRRKLIGATECLYQVLNK